MTSNPADTPPSARVIPRGIVIATLALGLTLMVVVVLQFRWKQDAAKADLQLANLQIAALEAALESENVLSAETNNTLQSTLRGSQFSARALLYSKTSPSSERPLAVVIWSDMTQSGQLILLTDAAFATSFSSMSGHLSLSGETANAPLSFIANDTSEIVSLHVTGVSAPPHQIVIKVLPRNTQETAAQWVGQFRR